MGGGGSERRLCHAAGRGVVSDGTMMEGYSLCCSPGRSQREVGTFSG